MREFPKIDRDAEDRAMQTLFFKESMFEGRTCKLAVANYLAFLSLRGPEIADEVAKLRGALSEPAPEHLERDMALLLRARNWRFHNIACVALACRGASAFLLAELWSCISLGSWTSPQLAATAAFVDPAFHGKASHALEDRTTYYKSLVALGALVSDSSFGPAELSTQARENVSEAKQLDRDNSGQIAVAWYQNLRATFGAA
jgi:hypothetical protein